MNPHQKPQEGVVGLLPCPFCGHDDPLCYPVEEGSKILRGGCDNADCILFDDFPGNYTSPEHFAQWWNTRATPTYEAGRRDMREAAGKVCREEADFARTAQANASTPTDKLYRMGQKDALLLFADRIDALPTEPLGGDD